MTIRRAPTCEGRNPNSEHDVTCTDGVGNGAIADVGDAIVTVLCVQHQDDHVQWQAKVQEHVPARWWFEFETFFSNNIFRLTSGMNGKIIIIKSKAFSFHFQCLEDNTMILLVLD